MSYDFNALEASAWELLERGQPADALKIYYWMATGDESLDGGYLGWRIGVCYEALGDLHAARYWHSRAVEENPAVCTESAEALARIGELPLDELIIVPKTHMPPAYSRKTLPAIGVANVDRNGRRK